MVAAYSARIQAPNAVRRMRLKPKETFMRAFAAAIRMMTVFGRRRA